MVVFTKGGPSTKYLWRFVCVWQEGLETWSGHSLQLRPSPLRFSPTCEGWERGWSVITDKGLLEVWKFGENSKPCFPGGAGVVAEMNRGGTWGGEDIPKSAALRARPVLVLGGHVHMLEPEFCRGDCALLSIAVVFIWVPLAQLDFDLCYLCYLVL